MESAGLGIRIVSFAQPLMISVRAVDRISVRVMPVPPLTPDEAFAAGNYGGAAGWVALEDQYNNGMLDLSDAIADFEA